MSAPGPREGLYPSTAEDSARGGAGRARGGRGARRAGGEGAMMGEEGRPLNYEPNVIRWREGDLVVHDADAKRADMLMRVVGYDRAGRCLTRYVAARVDMRSPRSTPHRTRTWANRLAVLHDPARFGIDVPKEGGCG